MKTLTITILTCFVLAGCESDVDVAARNESGDAAMTFEISKTDAEWQEQLTPEQYRIARQKGTERAFTGAYWDAKQDGIYKCVCCDQPLYDSKTKFKSGTGWPSFWDAVKKDAVTVKTDSTFGMTRSELLCSKCGAHLGHVFNDGPKPTGMRHCINSASLKLEPKE